jgi:hypothetical protein
MAFSGPMLRVLPNQFQSELGEERLVRKQLIAILERIAELAKKSSEQK